MPPLPSTMDLDQPFLSQKPLFSLPLLLNLFEKAVMTIGNPLRNGNRGAKSYQHQRPTFPLGMSMVLDLFCPAYTDSATSKRAKTEDEKEQRRIERVLRNRQAAQSSRERKRQEVEKLEGEKYAIERQNYMLKQRLMQVEHDKYRLAQQVAKMAAALSQNNAASRAISKAPVVSTPPSPTLTADLLQHDKVIKQELDDFAFSLPSPKDTLDPRSSFSSTSSSTSRSPSPSQEEFHGGATSPDMTQHPAAMLCGLQCQSGAAWRPSLTPLTPLDETQSRQLQQTYILHTLTILHLYQTLLSAVSSTLLYPLSQIFISLKTGSPLKSTTMTPMLFHLIQWLISTPVNPLTSTMTPTTPSSTLTTLTSIPKTNSTSSRLPRPLSTFRISLLRRLLACSPALARPLKDATGRALQMKTSYALRGIFKGGSTNESVVDDVNRVVTRDDEIVAGSKDGDARLVQREWRLLMTMAAAIDLVGKQKVNQKHGQKSKKEVGRNR